MGIVREPGAATRRASNAHFQKHRFLPKVRLELGSNEAIKQAVAGKLGLGVLSQHALATAPEDEGLAILPLDSFPIQSKWWVLYPKGKRLSPVASEFMTYLDKTFHTTR